MAVNTVGINFYPNFIMEAYHNEDEDFKTHINSSEHYKIVKCNEGTGMVKINNRLLSFMSPALFCLSETDMIEIVHSIGLKVESFYFHPRIVNAKFTFEIIRNSEEKLTLSELHDKFWLYPFFDKNDKYIGYIPLGPSTNIRISDIIKRIGIELRSQKDSFWPCRSRSYFIELLFITHRIYSESDFYSEEISVEKCNKELMDVIIFLNTNYEKKITISEITKIFGTNRTSLSEKFNDMLGMTVMEYLNKIRIQIAATMLRDTLLPVEEIIVRVGFNDTAYFGRVFKKMLGISPGRYRKENYHLN